MEDLTSTIIYMQATPFQNLDIEIVNLVPLLVKNLIMPDTTGLPYNLN